MHSFINYRGHVRDLGFQDYRLFRLDFRIQGCADFIAIYMPLLYFIWGIYDLVLVYEHKIRLWRKNRNIFDHFQQCPSQPDLVRLC